MYKYKPIFNYALQLAQVPDLSGVKSIGDLGYLVIIALVALAVAFALVIVVFIQWRQTNAKARADEKEESRLDRLIDQMIQLVSEFRTDKVINRQVIEDNSTTNRAVTLAATEQTGEIRLLRTDFKSYTTLQSDSFVGLRDEMVAFRGEIKADIEAMLLSEGATLTRVNEAVKNHDLMFKRLDQIIAQLTPPTPPPDKVIDLNGAADTPDLKETA